MAPVEYDTAGHRQGVFGSICHKVTHVGSVPNIYVLMKMQELNIYEMLAFCAQVMRIHE